MQIEKCDICGKLTAAIYKCRLCSRRTCGEHFKFDEGLCSVCHDRLGSTAQRLEETAMSTISFKLFFLGFFLMIIGVVVLMVAAVLQGGASISGVVIAFIGPIPIVLAAGPHGLLAVLLAVALTIIGFVMYFLLRRRVSEE